ncbi:T9SS type A sorting domain-containing protein [Bacteroidota bacterium]
MKKTITISILLCCTLFFAFTFSGDPGERQMMNNVVVQFIATNGNGNNIYLDNFSIGTQYNNDLTISSYSLEDKNYFLPGQTSSSITPQAVVFNQGRNTASGGTITMVVTSAAYTSTKTIPSLISGQSATITFDALTFNVNVSKDVKVYINWSQDQNHSNDSLFQQTIFLPGVKRKVLFEAYTNTSCGPCASQNPALDAFIQSKFDSVVAIKHHTWWPGSGDPMYQANLNQNNVRTYYYGISAVPTLMVDGTIKQVSGYTQPTLQGHLNTRLAMASPLSLTVTDTRLSGDTIKASVTLQVVSQLPTKGVFRLRIYSIERKITYASPPGSNGETIFYDVFREGYPTTEGLIVPKTAGTYNYEFKYKRQTNWVDSMMFTSVFVQNDNTKEVLNCAKARNWYADRIAFTNNINNNEACYEPGEEPKQLDAGFYTEGFATNLPPYGWQIINPDDGITFSPYDNVNGPSFSGTKGIRLRLYNYYTTGQVDYLQTQVYNNIDPSDSIVFDWAHANRPGYTDRMQVKLSTDGGTTFPYTVFDKSGANLATAGSLSSNFTPSSTSQWGRYAVMIGNITSLKPIVTNIPLVYSLEQNYPNPFNPSTVIEFSIPVKGFVKLVVHDVLGKEIEVLENSSKETGTYEYEFITDNLPSGIYFYTLIAEDFKATRKMLFIK